MAHPGFEDEMELHRVDCLSSNGFSDNYDFLRAKQVEFSAEQKPLVPPPLVNGRDVMALGIPAGPRVGELLGEAQDLQLEGGLKTREEALEWLRGRVEASS